MSLQLPIPDGWSPRGYPDWSGFSEAGSGNASGFARGLNWAGRAARLTVEKIGWAVEQMRRQVWSLTLWLVECRGVYRASLGLPGRAARPRTSLKTHRRGLAL